ncbi:MAG: hypothetical protein AAFW67_01615 [Cyanobacteria bacterium J06638_38]
MIIRPALFSVPLLSDRQIGVEIFRKVDDPETPDSIETQIVFLSVIVPDGWEVLNAWKAEEGEVF